MKVDKSFSLLGLLCIYLLAMTISRFGPPINFLKINLKVIVYFKRNAVYHRLSERIGFQVSATCSDR